MYEELIQFLMQEYLLDKTELKVYREASDRAKLFQAKLATLSADRKIQLLEYEWTLLPVERLKVTLVTATGYKEFIVEGP